MPFGITQPPISRSKLHRPFRWQVRVWPETNPCIIALTFDLSRVSRSAQSEDPGLIATPSRTQVRGTIFVYMAVSRSRSYGFCRATVMTREYCLIHLALSGLSHVINSMIWLYSFVMLRCKIGS